MEALSNREEQISIQIPSSPFSFESASLPSVVGQGYTFTHLASILNGRV